MKGQQKFRNRLKVNVSIFDKIYYEGIVKSIIIPFLNMNIEIIIIME